jgi:hypothetical protein
MPDRILSVGDAMSYMSFVGGVATNKLTSIDPATGTTNHWLSVYAARYNLSNIGATATGTFNVVYLNNDTYRPGLAAPCNVAPVSSQPCSLGTYDEIEAQVNQRLPTPQSGDLVVLTIGMGDIFKSAEIAWANGDRYSSDAELIDIKNLGVKYINLADQIYQKGFKHVLFLFATDFSNSAFANTRSAKYRDNLANLTKTMNLGATINCNGGCALGDDRPYSSRAEGVWRAAGVFGGIPVDTYAYLLNVTNRVPGYLQANINNNTVNSSNTTAVAPLCLYPAVLGSNTTPCTPNSLTDAAGLPYFYSGDLFLSPSIHTLLGNIIANYTLSNVGF